MNNTYYYTDENGENVNIRQEIKSLSYNDLSDVPMSLTPTVVYTQNDAIGTGHFGDFDLIKVSNTSYSLNEVSNIKIRLVGSSDYAEYISTDYKSIFEGFEIEYPGEYFVLIGDPNNSQGTGYVISLDADFASEALGSEITAGTYITEIVESIEVGGTPVINSPYDSLLDSQVFRVEFTKDENDNWSASESFGDVLAARSAGKLIVGRFFGNSMGSPVETILSYTDLGGFFVRHVGYNGYATGEVQELILFSIYLVWSDVHLIIETYRYNIGTIRQPLN